MEVLQSTSKTRKDRRKRKLGVRQETSQVHTLLRMDLLIPVLVQGKKKLGKGNFV